MFSIQGDVVALIKRGEVLVSLLNLVSLFFCLEELGGIYFDDRYLDSWECPIYWSPKESCA